MNRSEKALYILASVLEVIGFLGVLAIVVFVLSEAAKVCQ